MSATIETKIHVAHAAELCVTTGDWPGPSGEFVEVLAGELRDSGGNVLFEGSADDCVREKGKYTQGFRAGLRLCPTKWRRTENEICASDYSWSYAS
jgi:hypothetical protein